MAILYSEAWSALPHASVVILVNLCVHSRRLLGGFYCVNSSFIWPDIWLGSTKSLCPFSPHASAFSVFNGVCFLIVPRSHSYACGLCCWTQALLLLVPIWFLCHLSLSSYLFLSEPVLTPSRHQHRRILDIFLHLTQIVGWLGWIWGETDRDGWIYSGCL